MANPDDPILKIIVEAQNKAQATFEQVTRQLAGLQDVVTKLGANGAPGLDKVGDAVARTGQQMADAGNAARILNGGGGGGGGIPPLVDNLGDLASVALQTFGRLKEMTEELAQVAAEAEVVGTAMKMVGQNAGYTKQQLEVTEGSIRKLGISTIEARRAMTLFMQSELDAGDAAKLARVAQDLAVSAQMSSAQATETLTYAISNQSVQMLRQFGLVTTQDTVYRKYAATINKTADQLTEQERKQAFLTEVLKYGIRVTGTYTAAMEDAGKMQTSLIRLTQDAKIAWGDMFLPVLERVVRMKIKFLEVAAAVPRPMKLIIGLLMVMATAFTGVAVAAASASAMLVAFKVALGVVTGGVSTLVQWLGSKLAVALISLTTLFTGFIFLWDNWHPERKAEKLSALYKGMVDGDSHGPGLRTLLEETKKYQEQYDKGTLTMAERTTRLKEVHDRLGKLLKNDTLPAFEDLNDAVESLQGALNDAKMNEYTNAIDAFVKKNGKQNETLADVIKRYDELSPREQRAADDAVRMAKEVERLANVRKDNNKQLKLQAEQEQLYQAITANTVLSQTQFNAKLNETAKNFNAVSVSLQRVLEEERKTADEANRLKREADSAAASLKKASDEGEKSISFWREAWRYMGHMTDWFKEKVADAWKGLTDFIWNLGATIAEALGKAFVGSIQFLLNIGATLAKKLLMDDLAKRIEAGLEEIGTSYEEFKKKLKAGNDALDQMQTLFGRMGQNAQAAKTFSDSLTQAGESADKTKSSLDLLYKAWDDPKAREVMLRGGVAAQFEQQIHQLYVLATKAGVEIPKKFKDIMNAVTQAANQDRMRGQAAESKIAAEQFKDSQASLIKVIKEQQAVFKDDTRVAMTFMQTLEGMKEQARDLGVKFDPFLEKMYRLGDSHRYAMGQSKAYEDQMKNMGRELNSQMSGLKSVNTAYVMLKSTLEGAVKGGKKESEVLFYLGDAFKSLGQRVKAEGGLTNTQLDWLNENLQKLGVVVGNVELNKLSDQIKELGDKTAAAQKYMIENGQAVENAFKDQIALMDEMGRDIGPALIKFFEASKEQLDNIAASGITLSPIWQKIIERYKQWRLEQEQLTNVIQKNNEVFQQAVTLATELSAATDKQRESTRKLFAQSEKNPIKRQLMEIGTEFAARMEEFDREEGRLVADIARLTDNAKKVGTAFARSMAESAIAQNAAMLGYVREARRQAEMEAEIAAAAVMGVTESTVQKWKEKSAEIAALALYIMQLLAKIAKVKVGSKEWQDLVDELQFVVGQYNQMTDAVKKDIELTKEKMALQMKLNSVLNATGTIFGTISKAFEYAGKGDWAEAFGKIAAGMEKAGAAGKDLKKSFEALKDAKGAGAKAGAVLGMAQAGVEGYGALMQATDQKSTGMRVLGGAATGAKLGMAFGPWGALVGAGIGALFGALRGAPEWTKIAKDVGKRFGAEISDQLAKQIEATEKKLKKQGVGNAREMAEAEHFMDIINETGGITEKTYKKIIQNTDLLFNAIKQGGELAVKAVQNLGAVFSGMVDMMDRDMNGIATPAMLDFIKTCQEAGNKVKEVKQFLLDMAKSTEDGLNKVIKGAIGRFVDSFNELKELTQPGGTIPDLLEQLEEVAKTLQKTSDPKERAKLLQQYKDLKEEIEKLMERAKTLGGTLGKSLEEAMKPENIERSVRLMITTFESSMKSGRGLVETIKNLTPSIQAMEDAAKRFGITLPESFKHLQDLRKFVEDNEALANSFEGINQMLVGLTNQGQMSQQTFKDISMQLASFYQQARDAGLSEIDTLRLMQPSLQSIWQMAKNGNIILDEQTKKWLQAAEAQGLVGEHMKPINEQMLDGINKMVDGIAALIKFFNADLPASMDKAWSVGGKKQDETGKQIDNTTERIGRGRREWDEWAAAARNAGEAAYTATHVASYGHSPGGVVDLTNNIIDLEKEYARIIALTTDYAGSTGRAAELTKNLQNWMQDMMDTIKSESLTGLQKTLFDLSVQRRKDIEQWKEQAKEWQATTAEIEQGIKLINDLYDQREKNAKKAESAENQTAKSVASTISYLGKGIATITNVSAMSDKQLTLLAQNIVKTQNGITGVTNNLKTATTATGTFAATATSQMNQVYNSVNAISFGHSPGGLKEIPNKLVQAAKDIKVFTQITKDQLKLVEGQANDVNKALGDMVPEDIKNGKPIEVNVNNGIRPGDTFTPGTIFKDPLPPAPEVIQYQDDSKELLKAVLESLKQNTELLQTIKDGLGMRVDQDITVSAFTPDNLRQLVEREMLPLIVEAIRNNAYKITPKLKTALGIQ